MADRNSVIDLLTDGIKDLYSAEKQLTKAIPKSVKDSNDRALKEAFSGHFKETEQQVGRLEKVAEILEIKGLAKSASEWKRASAKEDRRLKKVAHCLHEANCLRRVAMSSLDGGQFAGITVQARDPDFSASSTSSREKVRVRLWLFGQTVSSSARTLIPRPQRRQPDATALSQAASAAGGGS